ncbi:Flp family type IVb pilin [Devosia sediminis]|uniref:Flp family type IVb pilin n=1 Tax=Devosia sediminis TaxID=2798801 RepID=A0A934MLG8_9HYPH|nr:Flp family type IVb pilin [Devosia sediminis]MBJ3786213.1 Flp family type IVb pilin [Devosia sediminis]
MLAQAIRRFAADESGATAMEYALLGTLIGVALIATFTVVGNSLGNILGTGAGGAANVISEAMEDL